MAFVAVAPVVKIFKAVCEAAAAVPETCKSINFPVVSEDEAILRAVPVVKELAGMVWNVSVSEETVQAFSSASPKASVWVPVGAVRPFQVDDPDAVTQSRTPLPFVERTWSASPSSVGKDKVMS